MLEKSATVRIRLFDFLRERLQFAGQLLEYLHGLLLGHTVRHYLRPVDMRRTVWICLGHSAPRFR